MDKAVILDVFDFVSFHVCKHLLNHGVEVHGIWFDECSNQEILEEKRMEIGRNANFFEDTFQKWRPTIHENVKDRQTFIFSLYDLFIIQKDSILKREAIHSIIQYIAESKNNRLVFLLPIQMNRFKEDSKIVFFVEEAKELTGNIQLFYLPAIYGPWQPSAFLFQQTIIAKILGSDIQQSEREWIYDALFVKDAVSTIHEIMESGKPGNYVLESGVENYWNRCADFLKLEQQFIKNQNCAPEEFTEPCVRISIKKLTPIAASLTEQIKHAEWQCKQHL
ncbi:hypothetical protein [Neobacillus fumarioli]|uniref:hypothetical protein n=1 Tax=Neobacillus fumarioli TaxID=105229 RepID=UPI000834FA75|nr:hypothetical protein [Neobacillus fumarioli]